MDMDTAKLDVFLTSQTKKKEGGLTPEQAKVYAKFWKNHRAKIHKAMVIISHVYFRHKNQLIVFTECYWCPFILRESDFIITTVC